MKTVGIVCSAYFQILHTRFIVEELKKNNINVVYLNFAPQQIGHHYDEIVSYLKESNEICFSMEKFYKNMKNFDAIIAHHFFPGLQLIDKNILKIRVQYGYAKDSWNYAEWNKVFDYVFTYGPYANRKLKSMTSVIGIGHPRQREVYDSITVDSFGTEIQLENGKKNVLYCPTWADISSLNLFLNGPIQALSEQYNIFIKLHHNLQINQENMVRPENVYYFTSKVDIFNLLHISDAVISDYSGAIFDAMIFEKPIVLLDTLSNDVKDSGLNGLSKMMNIMEEKNHDTNDYSLDIYVRNLLKHSHNSNQLGQMLSAALSEEIPYKDLLTDLYSFMDSHAAEKLVHELKIIMGAQSCSKKMNYKEIDVDKIIKFMEDNDKVAIWGAGELGQVICAWIQSKGYNIDYFFDIDDKKIGGDIDGIEICAPMYEYKTLIAVSTHHKSIEYNFKQKGYKENIDYIYPF